MTTTINLDDELIKEWLDLEEQYFGSDYGLEVNLKVLIKERIKELNELIDK